MATSTLQIRVDSRLRHDAESLLEMAGLDMSSAVRLFLRQFVIRRKLPFDVVTETPDPFWSEANQRVLRESIESIERGEGQRHEKDRQKKGPVGSQHKAEDDADKKRRQKKTDPAHRRGALFLQMFLDAFLAHLLSELQFVQQGDQEGHDEDGQKKARQHRPELFEVHRFLSSRISLAEASVGRRQNLCHRGFLSLGG